MDAPQDTQPDTQKQVHDDSLVPGSRAKMLLADLPQPLQKSQYPDLVSRIERYQGPARYEGSTHTVPGTGSLDADLLFIGEAPGAREDAIGEPFVGAAGKFLAEMLATIGMQRSDIFITNMVKWRPPNNRDPEPDEIAECLPFLLAQVALIQPALIITLGRHAMNYFLPGLKISEVHGKPFRKEGQIYLPLFHPAAALYNGALRDTLKQDFLRIPLIVKKIKAESLEADTILKEFVAPAS